MTIQSEMKVHFTLGWGVVVVGGWADGSEQLSPSKPKANFHFCPTFNHSSQLLQSQNLYKR